jgi:hypothetical protein
MREVGTKLVEEKLRAGAEFDHYLEGGGVENERSADSKAVRPVGECDQ